ncbi:MAG: DUF397 domain-containing protein [Streptosporangiaceae bacterium]
MGEPDPLRMPSGPRAATAAPTAMHPGSSEPPGRRGLRDSKNPAGPELIFSPAGWRTFVSRVKGGDYDSPSTTHP